MSESFFGHYGNSAWHHLLAACLQAPDGAPILIEYDDVGSQRQAFEKGPSMSGRSTMAELLSFAEGGSSEIAAIADMCRAAGCETSLQERERMAQERVSLRAQQKALAARCEAHDISKSDYVEAIEGLGDHFLAANRVILGEARYRSVFGDVSGAGLIDRTVFLGDAGKPIGRLKRADGWAAKRDKAAG